MISENEMRWYAASVGLRQFGYKWFFWRLFVIDGVYTDVTPIVEMFGIASIRSSLAPSTNKWFYDVFKQNSVLAFKDDADAIKYMLAFGDRHVRKNENCRKNNIDNGVSEVI